MNTPYLSSNRSLDRRHFLRGLGGTAMALPFLEAMTPSFARAAATESPQRMVAMCATLGFHTPYLFPNQEGADYGLTPYLEPLRNQRDKFSVISGLSHPNQQGNNGHASSLTWLTSAQRPGLAGFKNTISLDQYIAGKIGAETRFPSLVLSTNGGGSLSWTSSGVEIPSENSPERLFNSLFVDGSEKEIEEDIRGFDRHRSILDTVRGEAKKLEHSLGHQDREKLDEYFTSVRDLEVRLEQSKDWARRPKPHVAAEQPRDIDDRNDAIGRQRLMNDMIALALQTDSTRTVTFMLSGFNAVPSIEGVNTDWHGLSHHGKDQEKIDELSIIEKAQFEVLADFMEKLGSIEENGSTLLDQTAILYGSNLGNASSHNWRNLPIIVAGGGFRHGSYTAHDAEDNTPLANVFVSLAQHMGVEVDQFGSSTQAGIRGLEKA